MDPRGRGRALGSRPVAPGEATLRRGVRSVGAGVGGSGETALRPASLTPWRFLCSSCDLSTAP